MIHNWSVKDRWVKEKVKVEKVKVNVEFRKCLKEFDFRNGQTENTNCLTLSCKML